MTPLKRAFLALESAQARIAALEAAAREPIAVIGLACRVPGGGHDPESFWRILRDGVDAISPIPAGRWDVDALYHPDPDMPGRIATRAGGFLEQIDGFDPAFFGITPREAQGMDPQQRLLLEVCWEALENACCPPDRLKRTSTGVYIGMAGSDYAYLQLETGDRDVLDPHFASGIAHSVASGRLSYLLGLQGPSVTIDTACSSSLVATHLACQALRAGDCRMALAGGVNLILGPDIYIALSRARMLAPDGRCKTFDAMADGFARAEGCGVIVLKRLRDAQADGDRILAVIRGSAVNQDGPSSGLTAPNGPAQEAVIREALARAGVAPHEVGYIEAHGTGTQLGDPLEVTALGAVFGAGRTEPLLLGSVKTNLGHLEAAAGVTGLIKVVLALRHRQIPAHLHFRTPSPHIPWSDFPVRVPTQLTPWEPIGGRRIAGVSSFGFSGTNVHVVLEEAPETRPAAVRITVPQPAVAGQLHLFILSARDETALVALARRYAAAVRPLADEDLAALCCAAAGRAHHPQRAIVFARSIAELAERLDALGEGRTVEGVRTTRVSRREPPRIAFLFTGQGAQHAGMARALYESQPVFREALDRCAEVLDGILERSLLSVLFASPEEAVLLDETAYTQPALFSVEYALTQLWRAWGVVPDVVLGHSVGEYAAACAAGVLTLEDALHLIAERGRLMQSLPSGGAMAAIFADEETVAATLTENEAEAVIAAHNAPTQVVISGAAAAVDAVCKAFASRGVRCERLAVSHAFHSPLVEPILDAFEQAARRCSFASPALRLVSNISGRLAEPRQLMEPNYWRRHVRAPVRFAEGVRTLATLAPDVCVEVGPHPTLLPFVQACFDAMPEADSPTLVATLRKGRVDAEQIAEALGALYLCGADLDWRTVWSGVTARHDLPPYPFQRERYWFRARTRSVASTGRDTGHPLLGLRLRSAVHDLVQFENELRADAVPFLGDHVVRGRAILPATGLLEMALAAARDVFGEERPLEDVVIAEPLAFSGDEARVVQLVVRGGDSEDVSFEIFSSDAKSAEPEWQRHVEGRFAARTATPSIPERENALRERCIEAIDARRHYEGLAARGLTFGPSLQGVRAVWRRDGEAVGVIRLPEPAVCGIGDYVVHPALLDACLQVLSNATAATRTYLPLAIDSLQVCRRPGPEVHSHARLSSVESGRSEMLRGDVVVFDEHGTVAEIRGIALRALPESAGSGGSVEPFYEIAWQPESVSHAGFAPTPAELAAVVGPALEPLLTEHGCDGYLTSFMELESLSAAWIAIALAELGWQPTPGEHVIADELARRLEVLPRYHRLVGRFLQILAEDGVLRPDGAEWVVLRELPLNDATARVARLREANQIAETRTQLAARCGPHLAAILRGSMDPLEQLFPGGSTALAESLYRDSPEAKAFNQLVREAARAVAANLPEGRELRILEVGGGTGGTTVWVAPAMPRDRTRYLFTDVGHFMVARAREKFAEHAFMEFATFDLERDPAEQELAGRRFDLILAANVLHATSDLRAVLARLRDLLEPGGTLLMLEVAGLERWIDITFGLTEGWWAFRDTELRESYPLLTRERWLEILSAAGFEAQVLHSPDGRSREALIAARRPLADAASLPDDRRWLVLSDEAGVGAAVAAQLRSAGRAVTLLYRRAVPGQAPGALAAASTDEDTLFDFLSAHCSNASGVIHLWGLDGPEGAADVPPSEGQRAGLGSLLALVRALGAAAHATDEPPRVWIGTRGAQCVVPGEAPDIGQTPLWGLGKVVALEHPELRPVRIDLDPASSIGEQAATIVARLSDPGPEDEVAIRSAAAYVPRLKPLRLPAADPLVRLEKSASGVLDEIRLEPLARRAPGPGEVEIRVVAAGINFRDVLNAVAMRSDGEPLGGECSGRIVAVGPGVQGFAVGDHVVAIAEGCFATYAVADARHVAHIPPGIEFTEAATVPFAFMTAQHALRTLGRMRAGETVLIHAAAGGVGSAAVQLARRAGARIIATAGSEAKRAFLRAQGIEHVLDSRSLDFAVDVLAVTGGRGADLVLNSLAGEFIAASVSCLAPEGRFLEIGKRDIWSSERFLAERPHGRYYAIDLAAQRHEDPETSFALFKDVMASISRGELRPLPLSTFPLERAAEAFRFMAQARHIGKVVLTQHDCVAASLDSLRPNGSYLITGGLAGLGLLTAAHLVERGARHVVLVGRREPAGEALEAIAALRARGAEVTVLQADVARREEVERVIETIAAGGAPLRGIVHSAGTLSDGALLKHSWDSFAVPLRAKIDGTWALHELTRGMRLDFFVTYSSIASMLGSAGQGNHAAANAFMDALAARRRAAGLAALSVSWGAWSEIGAAADRGVDQKVAAQGIDVIAPRQGLEMLETLMRGPTVHVGAVPVRWDVFLARANHASAPIFAALRSSARDAASAAPSTSVAAAPAALCEELRSATPLRRHELLLAFVGEQVARVIGIERAGSIDPRQPLNELGLDSLMAVDLRNRLAAGLALPGRLPATLVFDYPTLEELAGYLDREALPPSADKLPSASSHRAPEAVSEKSIDELSDEEIERLYAMKLGRSS